MADWVRRSFTSIGLTQIPPGPHFATLQARYGGGVVMLCIDVSGSMDGQPIREAIRGAKKFVDEAIDARYEVGVMLWNHQIVDLTEPDAEGKAARKLLDRAKGASGGNDLIKPLNRCHKVLEQFKNAPDRVVAVFGDGDLTPKGQVLRKVAEMKAENIRFVTRGLGHFAAREFGEISSEEPTSASINDVASLAEGIAGMATSLKAARLTGRRRDK